MAIDRNNKDNRIKNKKNVQFKPMIHLDEKWGYNLNKNYNNIRVKQQNNFSNIEKNNKELINLIEKRYKDKEISNIKEIEKQNNLNFYKNKTLNDSYLYSNNNNTKLNNIFYCKSLNSKYKHNQCISNCNKYLENKIVPYNKNYNLGISKFLKSNRTIVDKHNNIKQINLNFDKKHVFYKDFVNNKIASSNNQNNTTYTIDYPCKLYFNNIENCNNTYKLDSINEFKDNSRSDIEYKNETKNLNNFIKSLNFNKYLKDNRIKEALNFIKNKIEFNNSFKLSISNKYIKQNDNYTSIKKLINSYFNDN